MKESTTLWGCYFFHVLQNESFRGHNNLFVHSFFFLLFFSDCIENESKVCISCDAGHYLCDFVFYKSLHSSQGKSLFIHVPPLNKPFSKEELAAIIVQAKSLYISRAVRYLVRGPCSSRARHNWLFLQPILSQKKI